MTLACSMISNLGYNTLGFFPFTNQKTKQGGNNGYGM